MSTTYRDKTFFMLANPKKISVRNYETKTKEVKHSKPLTPEEKKEVDDIMNEDPALTTSSSTNDYSDDENNNKNGTASLKYSSNNGGSSSNGNDTSNNNNNYHQSNNNNNNNMDEYYDDNINANSNSNSNGNNNNDNNSYGMNSYDYNHNNHNNHNNYNNDDDNNNNDNYSYDNNRQVYNPSSLRQQQQQRQQRQPLSPPFKPTPKPSERKRLDNHYAPVRDNPKAKNNSNNNGNNSNFNSGSTVAVAGFNSNSRPRVNNQERINMNQRDGNVRPSSKSQPMPQHYDDYNNNYNNYNTNNDDYYYSNDDDNNNNNSSSNPSLHSSSKQGQNSSGEARLRYTFNEDDYGERRSQRSLSKSRSRIGLGSRPRRPVLNQGHDYFKDYNPQRKRVSADNDNDDANGNGNNSNNRSSRRDNPHQRGDKNNEQDYDYDDDGNEVIPNKSARELASSKSGRTLTSRDLEMLRRAQKYRQAKKPIQEFTMDSDMSEVYAEVNRIENEERRNDFIQTKKNSILGKINMVEKAAKALSLPVHFPGMKDNAEKILNNKEYILEKQYAARPPSRQSHSDSEIYKAIAMGALANMDVASLDEKFQLPGRKQGIFNNILSFLQDIGIIPKKVESSSPAPASTSTSTSTSAPTSTSTSTPAFDSSTTTTSSKTGNFGSSSSGNHDTSLNNTTSGLNNPVNEDLINTLMAPLPKINVDLGRSSYTPPQQPPSQPQPQPQPPPTRDL